MNPLEHIDKYTSYIAEAANLLRRLGATYKKDEGYFFHFPLPTLQELRDIKDNLLSIHPKDIVNNIIYQWPDYQNKKRFIIDSLKGFLDIDAGIGAVTIDGVEYGYWDAMNKRISAWDKAEVEAYTNEIVAISHIIHDSTNGMRSSINYLFNEIVFEDRNVLADTAEMPHDEVAGFDLPAELNTERARKYFKRAIDAGLIKRTQQGFTWVPLHGRGANTQLGYFCCKVFSTPYPISALEKAFNVRKLSTNITNGSIPTEDFKRADVKRWRGDLDGCIFYD